MIQVYYISGIKKEEYSMVCDGFIDDCKSDFITCYRFVNCSSYMKHVYFTFPRSSIVRIKEMNDNDKKFRERFTKL